MAKHPNTKFVQPYLSGGPSEEAELEPTTGPGNADDDWIGSFRQSVRLEARAEMLCEISSSLRRFSEHTDAWRRFKGWLDMTHDEIQIEIQLRLEIDH